MAVHSASVGPYRVLGRVGAGGMGEVFLAEDPRLGRRVALKAVRASHAARPEARQRLLREARAAAALNHPGIAAIYDVLDADAGLYIVMEYVEGTSLDEIVRRGPLPIRRVLQIGLELAEALASAHAHGIVHRDLKPSNVRLTTAGHAKVLDFGLARTVDLEVRAGSHGDAPTAPLTDPDQFVGTPAYMAPEQLRGARGDQASDIYALGVVLFEMLTGQRPFEAPSLIELGVQALTLGVPDVRTLRPETPADLAAVVARATAREPADRLGSAQELRDLLQDVFAEQPTPSPVPSLPAPAPPTPTPAPPVFPLTPRPTPMPVASTLWERLRARPWSRAVAGALALALTAFLAWRVQPGRTGTGQPARASTVAVLPVAAPSGIAELESAAAGIGEILAANLAVVPGLQVLSRRETTGALGKDRSVSKVFSSLAPNYVVNAAVNGSVSHLRLDVSLVGDKGQVSWSRAYQGRADDPFSLPAQVSADVGQAMADLGAVSAQALAEASQRFQRPPTSDREAWRHYTDALRFLDRPDIQGNVARATTLLEEAVKKDAQFALGWAALGTAYSVQYEETKDERWLPRVQQTNLEALRLDPNRAETRIALAQMYQNTGAHDRAIDELKRATAFAPASDTPRRLLGGLYADIGKYDESVSVLKEAIDLRPGFWRNWSFLGYTYFQAGRHEEAMAAYERLLSLQPDNARGQAALGTVLHEMGRSEEARQHYQRALELDPNASAWSNLGSLAYFEGKYAEAARAYEEAVKRRPKDGSLHRNLGDALFASGKLADATRTYETALGLLEQRLVTNPRDADALSLRSVVEAKLGRPHEARQHAAEALVSLPNNKEVLYHSAMVATLGGRLDEASGLLDRALQQGYSVSIAARDPDLATLRQVPKVRERLAAGGARR